MLTYTVSDKPDAQSLLAVDTGLDEYNIAAAPLHEVAPLAVFVKDASGEVVGGAVGRTWGAGCELQQLWVKDELRKKGVGTRLLVDFEARARTRGCKIFYLTTLSFQAPDFYRRHGYGVLAQISGYPHGIVKYLMQKVED